MNYEIQTEKKEKYLYVQIKGTWNNLNYKKIIMETFQAFLCSNQDKIFIDYSQLSINSLENDEMEEGSYAAQIFNEKAIKVAAYSPANLRESLFFELAAKNRGLNIKTFTQKNKALKWLLE